MLYKMSPQTRTSTNSTKSAPPEMKPTLSQMERHLSLEKGKRVCIVCGKLSKIFSSVVYPKGKNRRKEFDNALCLPIHVSDALPAGCYICGSHFPSNEISYSMAGPAQITESTVPSLDLDHDFLRELCSLKEDEIGSRSAIRLVKEKLGWDTKPPLLVEQENSCESDENQDSNTPEALVNTLFGCAGFNKKASGKRKKSDQSSHPPPPSKNIRLVPVSGQNKQMSQAPPVLEKMNVSGDDEQPPALSPPVVRKSQRSKMPVLEASTSVIPSSSTPKIPCASNEIEKKDQMIFKLRQSLASKTLEVDLLRKKLRVTEELLQFYQENSRKNDFNHEIESLLNCRHNFLDTPMCNGTSPAQATAMLLEGNQTDLQQQLQMFLKSGEDASSNSSD